MGHSADVNKAPLHALDACSSPTRLGLWALSSLISAYAAFVTFTDTFTRYTEATTIRGGYDTFKPRVV